jgi:hypothetical protein
MRSPPARSRDNTPNADAKARPVEDKAINAILEKAVRRLEEAIEQETTALRNRTPIDLNEFNQRKNQGLLELDRALRLLNGAPPNEDMKSALRTLRRKLDENSAVLTTHIEAVRDVATIIAEAIRSVESDGTYSFSFRSKGPPP